MLYAPFALPFALIANLLSIGLMVGGVYLGWAWWTGVVVGTGYLVASIAATAWTFLGRLVISRFWPGSDDEPTADRGGRELTAVGPDETRIHVEVYGPETGPTLIFTHGWGMDSTAWVYARKALSRRFRVVLWDLPGLGKSERLRSG